MITKFAKDKPLLMFSRLPFYSWLIIRTIFSLKSVVRYLWTFKQQIILWMVFLKRNSLKSDIFSSPMFIHVSESPGFSGSSFFRVWVQGPGLGPGSGFRSSPLFVSSSKYLMSFWLFYLFYCMSKSTITKIY